MAGEEGEAGEAGSFLLEAAEPRVRPLHKHWPGAGRPAAGTHLWKSPAMTMLPLSVASAPEAEQYERQCYCLFGGKWERISKTCLLYNQKRK